MQINQLEFVQTLNTSLLQYKSSRAGDKTALISDLQAISKVQINFQHLQKTQFNKTLILIAKIKDISDEIDLKIIRLARELLIKWKQEYKELKQNTQPILKRKVPETTEEPVAVKKVKIESQKPNEAKTGIELLEQSRQGCIRIMVKALQQDFIGEQLSDEIKKKIDALAMEIEKGLYKKHNETVNQQYREDSRLLVSTMKKEENNSLRVRVMQSDIAISELIECKPETLIDQKIQDEMMKNKEQNIQARRSDWIMEQYKKSTAKGGGLMCIKCKSTKTMTNLVQTRGADEPMTEFNTCFNCGKTWKF